MATTLLMPAMAIPILILLLNPAGCNSVVNKTASEWCDRSENCLVGDKNLNAEFLMETETSRMLLGIQNRQTPSADNNPNQPSVAECGRPPRYDSCTGDKRKNPPPENCDPRNRVNPC